VTSQYLASGLGVWVATISVTTLLLIASNAALWLVVPLLLAIILFYLLNPIVRRLVLAGISREAAAGWVAGGFAVVAIAAMIPAAPWLAGQSVSGEESFNRYLDGGRLLLDRTLAALESRFGFLQRMNFQAEVARKMAVLGQTFVEKELATLLLAVAIWLPALLLAPFFTFFFLRDGRRFLKMLGNAVPNAFFERTIHMVDLVHNTARQYFRGLLKLTVIDTVMLAFGLWIIGVPGALALGLLCAVLAWVPLVGSVIGCVVVVLVVATDMPNEPWAVYAAVALFLVVRMLDDFVFAPLTVGRSMRMHPLPAVLMIFIGGAVAGVAGLLLALPLTGVVSAVTGTIGGVVNNPRLRARHAFARSLRARRINADLRL
jgi:predicted PurR-regulated permease PerM